MSDELAARAELAAAAAKKARGKALASEGRREILAAIGRCMAAGLDVRQMARLAGTSRVTIYRWMDGLANPRTPRSRR